MLFEITGEVKNKKLVEQYTENVIKKLQLHRRKHGLITIKFRKRMPNGFADSTGICEGDRDEAIINIAKKQTFYEQMLTLAHELVHAKQFMKGEYPSEREATKFEYELFGKCYPWDKVKY